MPHVPYAPCQQLLNDGKKWNRRVGAEYFCKKGYVPKSAVVFAWNWDAQEAAQANRRLAEFETYAVNVKHLAFSYDSAWEEEAIAVRTARTHEHA